MELRYCLWQTVQSQTYAFPCAKDYHGSMLSIITVGRGYMFSVRDGQKHKTAS
jgi:hypothetical protein